MRTAIKLLLLYFLTFTIIYGLLAVLTYNSIQVKIEKLELLEQELIEKQATGDVPYAFRQTYQREYNTYERLQNRLQSFWMKWIFNFPEFRNP
ncbi:hypothetical protein [Sutcliffiella halmapala]|uniref:hypothetical protein n=1 Tax=Sutcliffiella halmapala TaxID=79882 RepID=UPI000994D514|nr:hypothetical protein [Sutcliffiella halmapala]